MSFKRNFLLFPIVLMAIISLFSCRFSTNGHKPEKKEQKKINAQALFKSVSPSVFVIQTEGIDNNQRLGSGVAIASDEVVTNHHVVRSFRHKIWVKSGEHKHRAVICYANSSRDLAILKVPGLKAKSVLIKNSKDSEVGETVYSVGAPAGLELSLSKGLISGLREIDELDKLKVIQTTAAISPGSSGGGLFDSDGKLLGVTTAYLQGTQSINFAIPSEYILTAISEHNKPCWHRYAVASAMAQAGRADDAIEILRKATAEAPEFSEGWTALGEALTITAGLDNDTFLKAEGALHKAVTLDPGLAEAWYAMGYLCDYWTNIYGAKNTFSTPIKASLAYQHYVYIKPNDADGWINLACNYQHLGNKKEAIDTAEQAVERNPGSIKGWLVLGDAYLSADRLPDALSAYLQGTSIKSDVIPELTLQKYMVKKLSKLFRSLGDTKSQATYERKYMDIENELNALNRKKAREVSKGNNVKKDRLEADSLIPLLSDQYGFKNKQ